MSASEIVRRVLSDDGESITGDDYAHEEDLRTETGSTDDEKYQIANTIHRTSRRRYLLT